MAHESAWPKQHVAEQDGGESIAPHVARSVSVAAPRVEETTPAVAKPIVVPATPGTTVIAPTPAVVAPVVAPTEETITTEDIVIEIDD